MPPHPGPPIYANDGEGEARRVARRLPMGFAGDMPGITKVATEQDSPAGRDGIPNMGKVKRLEKTDSASDNSNNNNHT